MSVVSTPLKNEIAMQKDIFRLAAAIYSESSNVVSEVETQLQMVKTLLATSGNVYKTKSEIIVDLLDTYKYHISEDELEALIKIGRGVFLRVRKDDEWAYSLTPKAMEEYEAAQKNNIDNFIDQFISEYGITDSQKCKEAIHVYLYEITTTNINSYRILLLGKDGTQFKSNELAVDVFELSDEEKQIVYDFLSWDNYEKNAALGNLVYCCLEYCLLIHGDSPSRFLQGVIRKREIYLDTNIIFRALGINGTARQKVIIAFLEKCKQAKLKLIISYFTNKEFFDTINYYMSTIEAFPRGNVYPDAYVQISDYNIYAFYEEWRHNHSNLPLKYFEYYIKSKYSELIQKYAIVDNQKIPRQLYDSEDFKSVRNRYSTAIKYIKQNIKEEYLAEDDGYTQRDSHDATMVRYIELLRKNCEEDQDIFLVSSDKALRLWDMNRVETKYPVIIYPSQLFLILLKTCGRSQNDFDSFVSFINIHPHSKQITPENAHIILSGISSITEDIQTQEHLVSVVYGKEFQDVIQSSTSDMDLYEKVQRITQNYLDDRLSASEENNKQLAETVAQHETEIGKLKQAIGSRDSQLGTTQDALAEKTAALEESRRKIAEFAENRTKLQYRWKVYGIPALLVVLSIAYIAFVALQFFAGTEKWNFVIKFFEWVKTTPFGLDNDGVMYIVDAAFLGGIVWLYSKLWRNPFDKERNKQLKVDLVQSYLSQNDIG